MYDCTHYIQPFVFPFLSISPLFFVSVNSVTATDATIVSSAVAYISFYLLGWSPMFWTAG